MVTNMSLPPGRMEKLFKGLETPRELAARDLGGVVPPDSSSQPTTQDSHTFDTNTVAIEAAVDSLFKPFIDQFKEAFKTAFPDHTAEMEASAIETLKQRLQPIIYHVLDKELKIYRQNNSIQLVQLTAIEAQQHFINFISVYKSGHNSLSAAFMHNYPELRTFGENATQAYSNSLDALGRRLASDIERLRRFFSATSPDGKAVQDVKLTNITSSGSDPHNDGQQVLILTFNVDGNERKIVYKPTSVEIDARIAGNSDKLKFATGEEQQPSFFEVINGKKPEYQMPTYLIMPRCDPGINNIGGAYGYEEHLSHSPWYDLDIDEEAKKFFGKFTPSQRWSHVEEFQKHIDQIFNNALEKGSKAVEKCDYITDRPLDVERYSYLCGAYAAAMSVLGITDMHVENVIISDKKPYLIDLEVALKVSAQGVDNSLAFDPIFGAFLSGTRGPAHWSCVLDVEGEFSPRGHNKIEKNRYYTQLPKGCLFISADSLKPCDHDYDHVERGFKDVVNIICNDKPSFLSYLDSLNDIPIRAVPIATSDMYGTQAGFIAMSFTAAGVDGFAATIKEQRLEELKGFAQDPKRERTFIPYSPEYFVDQLSRQSIPSYYLRANNPELLDCRGNAIPMQLADSFRANLSESDITRLTQALEACVKSGQMCYYSEGTPIKGVKDGIVAMTPERMLDMLRGSAAATLLKSTTPKKDEKDKKDGYCGPCRIC
jgi:hypothetical protein